MTEPPRPAEDQPAAGQPAEDLAGAAELPGGAAELTSEAPELTSEAAPASTDAARLLVRALAQLPAADRDRVYTWLLGTSLSPQAGVIAPLSRRLGWAVQADAPRAQQDFAESGADLVRNLFRSPATSAQQMVPVRFSADQHARLRAWCAEHGFSMATVIRGLVDRFLDSQQPGSA
jgi:hypothetical protein